MVALTALALISTTFTERLFAPVTACLYGRPRWT
jgi:hypothetical protein